MGRIFFICLLILAAAQISKGQTNASGSVKDEKGNPLHFVFVADSQYNTAVYSDSLGNFTISVHPDSKLKFELRDYKSIERDSKMADWQVVLQSLGKDDSKGSLNTRITTKSDTAFQRRNDVNLLSLPGHSKGNLRGSRYLFDNFAHGFILNSSDILVHDPAYLLDYDKLGGALLFTSDKKTVNEMSWDETKSFTLYNDKDECFVFEKVPVIDKSHYVLVLASGSKYKIYKLIKTRFVKSDYVNNGVTAHGNDYDEYIDDADYYVLDVQANKLQKLLLKKKPIKEDFAKDADKVNKYLSDNSGNIDDTYLSKLGTYMNQ